MWELHVAQSFIMKFGLVKNAYHHQQKSAGMCIIFDILHHSKGEKLQKYLIKKENYFKSLRILVKILLTNI